MQPAFRLVSRIYEKEQPFPIVIHIFYGRTPEQAQSFYRAHQKSDRFLSGCINGAFMQMPCREEHVLEQRVGASRWKRIG